MNDLHDEVLEQRLRAACQAVIPHLSDERVVSTDDLDLVRPDRLGSDEFAALTPLEGNRWAPQRSRAAVLVAVAALVVLTAGGLLALHRGGTSTSTAGNAEDAPGGTPTGAGFVFETPTVSLQAASIDVISGDQTFSPTGARVFGDPGMPNEYTTLELTWQQGGSEQRIDLYFRSDGTDWWVFEIRTYDVSQASNVSDVDWHVPIATGEFFTTPIGEAFHGDLDLPNLRITGMTLQAFRTSEACRAPTTPTALIADFPEIDASIGSFAATLQVIDTATCTALPVSPYSFEYTSNDPSVAAIGEVGWPAGTSGVAASVTTVPGGMGSAPTETVFATMETKTRVSLQLHTPGLAVVQVTAHDAAGAVVGTATMRITVRVEASAPNAPGTTVSTSDDSTGHP